MQFSGVKKTARVHGNSGRTKKVYFLQRIYLQCSVTLTLAVLEGEIIDCQDVSTPFNSTLGSDSSLSLLFLHSAMPGFKVLQNKFFVNAL